MFVGQRWSVIQILTDQGDSQAACNLFQRVHLALMPMNALNSKYAVSLLSVRLVKFTLLLNRNTTELTFKFAIHSLDDY